MASYNNHKPAFYCIGVVLALFLTLPECISSTHVRSYRMILIRFTSLHLKIDELRKEASLVVTGDEDSVNLRSSISPIACMNEIFDEVNNVFNIQQIGNKTALLIGHLRYLNAYKDVLTMMYEATGTASGEDSAFQSDFKVTLTAVIQRTTGIISGISNLIASIGKPVLSSSLALVNLTNCDVETLISRQGLFLLQEFDYYTRLARLNFLRLAERASG